MVVNTIKLSQFPPNTELLIIMEGEAGWRAEFVLVWINIGFLRSNCVFHNKIEITNLNRLFVLFFVNTLSVSARLQCLVLPNIIIVGRSVGLFLSLLGGTACDRDIIISSNQRNDITTTPQILQIPNLGFSFS